MRLGGYHRDVPDEEARLPLVRRRPLRPESRDWYGPGDVAPYYPNPMPHRTRVDELQRPNGGTPRGYSRSMSLDAYPPPTMPMPPAHLMRASTDVYKKRPQFSVYEADEDDEDDVRIPPMKPRGRHPEPARPRRRVQRPREPTPESTPPTESEEDSESESESESEDDSDDERIEVVVEEHERGHKRHHRHHRRPSPDDYLSSPDEKRIPRRRDRIPSPSTSDDREVRRYRHASSERGSPDRRPALRRELTDTPRYSLPTRFNSVLDASRPPVASRRTTKVIESREIVREGRPRRLIETVEVSRESSRRPPSIAGSGFETSRNSSRDRPRIIRDCKGCLDEVPASRCPKLECGHRMCHSCLKKRFKQSMTDAEQMPPTCCTDEHIDLEHVDKLFDPVFKKIWNKKFVEASLKNRLYCPSRRCGEWIRPVDIYHDRDTGRKAARCERCNTKVCVACNGRWHFGGKCPRDDETAKYLAQARSEGRKRCIKCGATSQLKDGDNHAFCRCGAEFCVVCGEKPKRCECPWFDIDIPDSDHEEKAITRRERSEIQVFREGSTTEESRGPRRPRGKQPRPQIYDEEVMLRQKEDREDELVRRPRYYAKDDEYDVVGAPEPPSSHYMEDSPKRLGRRVVGGVPPSPSQAEFERGSRVGRGGYYGGRMDRRKVERHAEDDPYEMEPPGMRPPPMGMPPPVMEGGYRGGAGPLIVERDPNTYDDDDSYYSHSSRSRKGTRRSDARKSSELAGLSGRNSGMGRIDVWRKFVEPGDPEGELGPAVVAV
ncbi:hypothetical protein FPOA_07809 [Fusarium poae]|uniref:RBR-type E3 ubiquitin transferase n=1 Tax=Fusarium poae TaxID=36050 RepID=A0A1B8AMD1_FUSPO|nr:hypothetical protein FPOA_07809 [Fusarium poae]